MLKLFNIVISFKIIIVYKFKKTSNIYTIFVNIIHKIIFIQVLFADNAHFSINESLKHFVLTVNIM